MADQANKCAFVVEEKKDLTKKSTLTKGQIECLDCETHCLGCNWCSGVDDAYCTCDGCENPRVIERRRRRYQDE